MSCEDLVRGLPRLCFSGPAACSDVVGNGPLLGDDRLGLGGCDRGSVGVGDVVGHAPVQHGPGPFGQPGGHDAEGLEVVGAAVDQLRVVDLGQLRVLFAGVVGGPDQGGTGQPGSGFGDGLAFAVGVAGL